MCNYSQLKFFFLNGATPPPPQGVDIYVPKIVRV